MKRKLCCLLFCLLFLTANALPALAAAPNGTISVQLGQWRSQVYTPASATVVELTLNGQPLEGDMPAMIQGGRTLVPVRLVGEALQAQVLWVQATGQVILIRNGDVVVLTLDSPHAVVNGVAADLPDGIPAMAVRYQDVDRTMIPLRFVSEALGAQVEWDQEHYTAHLTAELLPSPSDPTPPSVPAGRLVTDIQANANAQTVLISTDHTPEYRVLDLGDRVAVDILGAGLKSGLLGTIVVDNELISAVRYAQHGDTLYPGYDSTVRIVLDLKEGITYQDNVKLEPRENGLLLTTYRSDPAAPPYLPPVPVHPEASTIVIDPGHGGVQPGAIYEEIEEKHINLSVSRKLEALLRELGYNVVMTRYDDSHIGLYERADLANAVGADLFVSLHSNAAVKSPDYTGIYTYHYPNSQRGAALAQAIQSPVCAMTGAIDRGIQSADFVVLRETDMCAVLVEMGFMTNHGELTQLLDDMYQTQLARGIAQGIVDYLNSLVD